MNIEETQAAVQKLFNEGKFGILTAPYPMSSSAKLEAAKKKVESEKAKKQETQNANIQAPQD